MNKETLVWVAIAVILIAWFTQSDFVQLVGSSLVEKMANAIQRFEGWFPGSRSQKNNNPGNLRYYGGSEWQGQVGVDEEKFIIFDTYENGRRALIKLITRAASGELSPNYDPRSGLYSFFSKYAPSNDGNNPKAYAEAVAAEMEIDPNTPISQFV